MIPPVTPGQKVIIPSAPELGTGTVCSVRYTYDHKDVLLSREATVHFPTAPHSRQYSHLTTSGLIIDRTYVVDAKILFILWDGDRHCSEWAGEQIDRHKNLKGE